MPLAVLSGALQADQGADFHFVVTYKDTLGNPVNLAGYTAAFMWAGQGPSLPADLRPGSGLTLGSDGTISGLVPAAQTAAWSFGVLAFELFVTSPAGTTDVLLAGTVMLTTGRTP